MDPCQHSSLANSETCQACAHCCKTLRIWVHDCEGIFERLQLLDTDLVSAKKVKMAPQGEDIVFIDLNIPCSQLGEENGKYFCKIWDSPEKPRMCRLYPSNQFISMETQSIVRGPKLIEKIIDANHDYCPILADLTAEEVVEEQNRFMAMWKAASSSGDKMPVVKVD